MAGRPYAPDGCLHISDMIFWPAGRSRTAEDIVDHAWSCTPISL
ncbi:hypothetical protein [Micromonospora sp. NPDC005254]